MCDNVDIVINDIRNFQRYGCHEEAIECAKTLIIKNLEAKKQCEVYKLLCLSYRKLNNINYALIYINKAVNIAKKELHNNYNDSNLMEYGICLMNKGVVYDFDENYAMSKLIYKKAIDCFEHMGKVNNGIIANALVNYSEVLYKIGEINECRTVLKKCISIIDDVNDMRLIYAQNKLKELQLQ